MLLLVSGASGAGKSAALARLERNSWPAAVRCVEFDSIGVPSGADTAWRHAAIETWVARAIDAQDAGEHLMLFGQVPMGELLAAPSAHLLDGVAFCIVTCSPEVRRARLTKRGVPEGHLDDHIAFGEWFRQHTLDPTHRPEVIRVKSSVPMRWDRWDSWKKGDPRWVAHIIHTDRLTPEEVARAVEVWARGTMPHAPA